MAFRLSTASRDAACNAIVDSIDVSGPGTMTIRTTAQPTNVGDAEAGALLGTVTWAATAFGASSTGAATAGTIAPDTNAAASGTAGHFRIFDGVAGIIADGTCGLGSGDLDFDNNVIVAGGTIDVTAFVVTVPI